jgi:hypothetical protein
MADPRIPEEEQQEARLPGDLDQVPDAEPSPGRFAGHGSEDAQLRAGEGEGGDDGAGEPDHLGPVEE